MRIVPSSVRRHSPWVRKHRKAISAALAAIVVGCSALALTVSGAAPATATWNLPYPQTMSYRVLSEDRAVQCKAKDGPFMAEVAQQGLDKYEIDMVAGQRGTCGRLKAEQFKRLYPSKMVILYENTAGADPLTWPGGTWAGYYLMMNRTAALTPVTAVQTSIVVADPSAFTVGDTSVMWSPTSADPYANSEWVKVTGISGSTLTIKRNIFLTGVQTYLSPPMIAAEATGSSYPYPTFNFSSIAPVNPANGLQTDQWMANNIVNDFAPSVPTSPTLDGVEFDGASWAPPVQNDNGTLENVDCDGDGVIDYCNTDVGTSTQVNAYGIGYDSFIQSVKQGLSTYDTDANRPPKMVLADGELRGDTGFRSIGSADGAEFESFPTWDNYANSSPALDTLGVWTGQDTAPGPHLSYAFTKDVTPVYPQVSPVNPLGCVTPDQGGTCRNGEYRYGMTAALMTGGASAYNNEASFNYPQPWDEEATVNTLTTNLAPGYLGQPLGPPVRTTAYTSANLTANPSFETDLTAVSSLSTVPGAMTVSQDTSTAAPGSGTSSLRADVTALTTDPSQSDNKVSLNLTAGVVNPGEYTIDFWAKAVNNAAGPQALNLGVGLDGTAGNPAIMVTNTWTHYYLQVNAIRALTKKATVKFSLGTQIGTYWLDNVNVYQGTAGVMTREFTNGIAVLNDSISPQANVALPDGPYHHINGAQDRSINDGTEVGSILPAIAAKDGEILLRD